MSTILDSIVAAKWREVEQAQNQVPIERLREQAEHAPAARDFLAALRRPRMRLIAEVKKASPSAGIIRDDFDPLGVARTYAENGADCISVLTDQGFFQGHLDDLSAIRDVVSVPLLRKDFMLDPYQLLQAKIAGADAVLLIAEILPNDQLDRLYHQANTMGMQVLMELHDPAQLNRVLDTGCSLIGINNRDLRTFETRLEHTLRLCERIPTDRCVVSESGIRTPADLTRLEAAGVSAVLVGESLMRAPDIGRAVQALLGRSTLN